MAATAAKYRQRRGPASRSLATILNPPIPRLFANTSKWASLPDQIYQVMNTLSKWNRTFFRRADEMLSLPPPDYEKDGTSGILDIARTVQLRIKHWAYAYRLTNDPEWKDRIWKENRPHSRELYRCFVWDARRQLEHGSLAGCRRVSGRVWDCVGLAL